MGTVVSNPQRRQHGQEPLIVGAALTEPHQVELDSNGRGQIKFPSPGPGSIREVERLVVRVSGSSAVPTAIVYIEAEDDKNIVEGTANGDLDFADFPRGLRLPADTGLIVVWEGGDAGAVATARLQYVDVQWVDVETGGR